MKVPLVKCNFSFLWPTLLYTNLSSSVEQQAQCWSEMSWGVYQQCGVHVHQPHVTEHWPVSLSGFLGDCRLRQWLRTGFRCDTGHSIPGEPWHSPGDVTLQFSIPPSYFLKAIVKVREMVVWWNLVMVWKYTHVVNII